MSSLKPYLQTIQNNQDLSAADMQAAMSLIMEGQINDIELSAFLFGLSVKGESTSEITGAANVMRDKASKVSAPANAIDCCGTGGDASGTYNISTAVAIVAASCGVPIAKHGNRSASSKSGAADVLEALGVNLDAPKDTLEEALKLFNFAFLMAPKHHGAIKHVVPVRKALATRTIFNLLGPLANPANTKRQLIGVFDAQWLVPMAETLRNLGTEKAWIVHGYFNEHGGIDEISTTGDTQIAILDKGEITTKTLSPEDFGLRKAIPESLIGGEATQNAAALSALLDGKESAYRDIVLANCAAVLMIADKASTLPEAVAMAKHAIESGAAKLTLENYINITKENAYPHGSQRP